MAIPFLASLGHQHILLARDRGTCYMEGLGTQSAHRTGKPIRSHLKSLLRLSENLGGFHLHHVGIGHRTMSFTGWWKTYLDFYVINWWGGPGSISTRICFRSLCSTLIGIDLALSDLAQNCKQSAQIS